MDWTEGISVSCLVRENVSINKTSLHSHLLPGNCTPIEQQQISYNQFVSPASESNSFKESELEGGSC